MHWEVITGIGTIAVAIAAFALAISEFRASRRHDKMSVRPLLGFEANYDITVQGFGIFLTNKGVGPAIIDHVRIYLDGRDVTGVDSQPIIPLLAATDLNYKFVQHFAITSGTPIAVAEKLPILTANPNELDDSKREHLRKTFPRIGISIDYRSVYDERFKADLKENRELLGDKEWLES